MKFTDSHEWVQLDVESNIAIIGITSFAQQELGDIVYVELPQVGKKIQAQQEIAVLESTKAAADIYSPVSGKVIAVNTLLKESPQLINQHPEELGWICKIELSDRKELDALLSHSEYESILTGAVSEHLMLST